MTSSKSAAAAVLTFLMCTDDDRSIMTEAIEPIPKEEKVEQEIQKIPVERHRKDKPFKSGRGRMSTPERRISRREPSATSRDEVRRKKGPSLTHL